MSNLLYSTDLGKYYLGKCEETIRELDLKDKVQLILTSPPFPLNNKKQYGNLNGEEYLNWFATLAELFSGILAPRGVTVAARRYHTNRQCRVTIHMLQKIHTKRISNYN